MGYESELPSSAPLTVEQGTDHAHSKHPICRRGHADLRVALGEDAREALGRREHEELRKERHLEPQDVWQGARGGGGKAATQRERDSGSTQNREEKRREGTKQSEARQRQKKEQTACIVCARPLSVFACVSVPN